MTGKRDGYFQPRLEDEGLDGVLVLLAILLFDALLGISAALSLGIGDTLSAIAYTGIAAAVFLGLVVQMVFGLTRPLRFFYGLTGMCAFLYLVVRGGQDASGLFGALGLVFGFVAVLGWRMAASFLGTLAVALTIVFYRDLYLFNGPGFPLIVETRFYLAFVGLSLLALGYGYAVDTRIRSLQSHSLEMSALAFKDEMTNLPNRRSTEEFLAQRWQEYQRSGNDFAVLLCNIDDLKALNDQYGAGFGDGVILRIANALGQGLRSQDIIARWGGDEFLIILPGQTYQTALKVAERVRSRVERIELVMKGQPVRVTISIGVAAVENAMGVEDMLGIAEAGLYQAKKRGKNRVLLG